MTNLKVFLFQYTEPLDKKTFDLLIGHTDAIQREKILSFRIQADADRSLLGFILSKYIGIRYFKCPEGIRMGVGEHGKPFYFDQNHYHFNISHSGDWIICAADSNPVGCDVQKHKSLNLGVARRFYHPKEYRTLSQLPKHRQEDYFFTLWVLKESYIKALGKGFTMGMNSYFFNLDQPDQITVTSDTSETVPWYFLLIELDALHRCAVCVKGKHEKITKNFVDLEILTDFF